MVRLFKILISSLAHLLICVFAHSLTVPPIIPTVPPFYQVIARIILNCGGIKNTKPMWVRRTMYFLQMRNRQGLQK